MKSVLVTDPQQGQVLTLPVGTRLDIHLSWGGLASTWQVEESPGHVLPLASDGRAFAFLVFGAEPCPTPLRLVRYRDGQVSDQREVFIVPAPR